MRKLNIGAGGDILGGYINMDVVDLPGIDVVHDLNIFPWPFADDEFEEISADSVLEHLDDFMKSMEELFRILKPGGKLKIVVPYWNSWCAHADPTHKRGFHELTFTFFDPDSPYGQERHYYTKAKFHIRSQNFVLVPFTPYLPIPFIGEIRVKRKWSRNIIGFVGNLFSNIILDLEIELEKI